MNISNLNIMPRDYKTLSFHEVKVIGIGGAGKNAINNLKKLNIKDIDLIALNTDAADIEVTDADFTILLGPSETRGNGAGNNPEIGKRAAMEVITQIEEMLDTPTISRIKNSKSKTQMVFIVAGMGGGTGTGAAPVVAKLCRDRNILTIGVVVTPQKNEGNKRLNQANEGMKEMQKYVDSLMVVDNQKMVDIFPDYPYDEILEEGDMILATAVKAVSDIITKTYSVNVDYNDIESTLENSQFMTVGTARRGGENRAIDVVDAALNSPLLKDNCIVGARRAILVINYNHNAPRENKPTPKEIDNMFVRLNEAVGQNIDKIHGKGHDESLENDIEVVIMVSDFKGSQDLIDDFEIKLKEFNNAIEKDDVYLAWELISELKKLNANLGNDLSKLVEKLNDHSRKIFEDTVNIVEAKLNIENITKNDTLEIEELLNYMKEKILPIINNNITTASSTIDKISLLLENKKDEIKYLPKYHNLKSEIDAILSSDDVKPDNISQAKASLKQIEYDINKLEKYLPDISSIVLNLNKLIEEKKEMISKIIIDITSDNIDFETPDIRKKIDNELNHKENFGNFEAVDLED